MKSRKSRILSVLLAVCAILFCTVLLASCGKENEDKKPPKAVEASSIRYDGTTISWNAAEGATSYDVTFNGVTKNTATTKFVANIGTATEAAISIVSKKQNDLTAEAASVSLTRLATVGTPTFDPTGTMSWDSIDGAAGYQVEINGTITETELNAGFHDFKPGTPNRIRIRAKADNQNAFATWSEAVTKTFLAPPTDIKYDGQYITWVGAKSNSAQTYTVFINSNPGEDVSAPNYRFDSRNSTFTVAVQINGDGVDAFSSQKSETVTFACLAQVENFYFEEGVLSWDPVANAVAYEVEVNGAAPVTVKEPIFKDFAVSSQYRIRVRPIGDLSVTTYYTNWSLPQTLRFLSTPKVKWDTTIALNGNEGKNFHWDAVNGTVQGYTVKVVLPDGTVENHEFGLNQKDLPYKYEAVGVYKVSVKAVATPNSDSSDSPYSAPITVIRLPEPKLSGNSAIISDASDLSKGFTVSYQAVSGATSYQLYKDGVKVTAQIVNGTQMSVFDIVDENTIDQQTVSYFIQSVGGVQNLPGGVCNAQTVITLDSLTTGEAHVPFEITVLARPTGVTFEGGRAMWDPSEGAAGYTVTVGKAEKVSTNAYDFAITERGNYLFKVNARGNGGAILSSPYTPAVNIVKLAPPTNIRIDTNSATYKIEYERIAGAKSYEFSFDNMLTPIAESEVGNIRDRITESTVSVNVRAVRNEFDDSNNTYYLSSEWSETKQFTKLRAVSEVRFTNEQLLWNDTNSSETPLYYVEIDGYAYPNTLSSTALSFADCDLEPGMEHSFRIRARGNGTSTVDSDLSQSFSIFKLAAPEVTRTETGYTWNSIFNAGSYAVYVDGELAASITESGKGSYEFVPQQFKEIKDYTITVQAIGDNALNSINSDKTIITQTVKKLGKINERNIILAYSESCFDPTNGKLTISLKEEGVIANASGYAFNVGITQSGKVEGTSWDYTPLNAGAYNISIQPIGGVFGDDNVYYLDGDFCASVRITFLTEIEPNDISLRDRTKSSVQWKYTLEEGMTGPQGFKGTVTYKDGTTQDFTIDDPRINYFQGSQEITSVTVYCVGNGKTTITSAPTTKTFS